MKVLAIDTATERCSVALRVEGSVIVRAVDTARGHAELVLPMVDEVMKESGLALRALDGIAYGRGPGAFTGVRIAVGVVQGLAFGAELDTAGISNLAAVAQQIAQPGDRVLVCMDARMGEVYWGVFDRDAGSDLVTARGVERVSPPDSVAPHVDGVTVLAGTGVEIYPELPARFQAARIAAGVLPHAREIALLGQAELRAGRGRPAQDAQPVYLRDRVTFVRER